MAKRKFEQSGKGSVVAGPLSSQIGRFDERYWKPIGEIACLSPRVAQLAHSHPFLLFALAVRYGPVVARQAALRQVIDGRALGVVCETMGIPLCFKKLPPEACDGIPVAVQWSTAANRALAAAVPCDPVVAGNWLKGICLAHAACNEKFAVWLARFEVLFDEFMMEPRALTALAVHAWHSQQNMLPVSIAAQSAWTPRLGLKKALLRAQSWGQYLSLLRELEANADLDPWIPEQEFEGLQFVPIISPDALMAEAIAMRNCLMSYADSVHSGHCRLFSVRRGDQRLANVEVRYFEKLKALEITQIKGPQNTGCPRSARKAAERWIAANAHRCPPNSDHPDAELTGHGDVPPELAIYCEAKRQVIGRIGRFNREWLIEGLGQLSLRPRSTREMMRGRRRFVEVEVRHRRFRVAA